LLAISAWATVGATYFKDKVVIGKVVDADTGAPVAGATIRLGQLSTLTDVDGYFRLASVQRPERLVVEAAGYYPQVRPVKWAWWRKVAVVKLRLQPARLTGVVVDAWSDQPLAGAIVRTEHAASFSAGGSAATTDRAGRFALSGLVPPAEVTVSAPGYLTRRSVVADPQSLAPGAEWRAALTPNTVTGTVRAADSYEPLASAAVSLGDQAVTTDELGGYRLHRVAPGATIHITPPGEFTPTNVTYRGGGELATSVEPRHLIVTAHDGLMGGSLPGTVVHAQGISRMLTSDGAQFTRIAPGTQLQLTREGYLTTEITYQGEAHLDVTLQPYALQGVVRDGDTGQPAPGAILYVDHQILEADDSGFYRIPELAADSQITIKASGFRKASLLLEAGTYARHSLYVATVPCAQELPTPGPLCLDLHLTPFQARGLYMPFGLLANPGKVRGLLDLIEGTDTDLNSLVVDVKGDRGYLAYDSQIPLAVELGVSRGREDWLPLDELLAEAQARGIYTIARMVVFKDNPLALGRPEWAVGRADGTVWTDGEGLGWGNPFREEVWDYNIAIAQELAALGFDEVQFDYLRFPSDGDIGAIAYAEENTLETRSAAIREFTRRVTEALRPYGVFTSADVFGLTVWVDPESDMSIGQRVIDVAPLVDYLCPMVYPSTFRSGNLGYADPSAYPYDVIYRSQLAAEARVPPTTRVRPWLQAYWYTLDEMLIQKQAATDAGASGWTFWNAGGVYDAGLFTVDE
jgi:protocatechuate 3,4-dioxygenase beta subunit